MKMLKSRSMHSPYFGFNPFVSDFDSLKRSDGLIQNRQMDDGKAMQFTVRSLNENKIIKRFHIELKDDGKEPGTETAEASDDDEKDLLPEPMFDFMEYHHGFLYVKRADATKLNVYDVEHCSLSLWPCSLTLNQKLLTFNSTTCTLRAAKCAVSALTVSASRVSGEGAARCDGARIRGSGRLFVPETNESVVVLQKDEIEQFDGDWKLWSARSGHTEKGDVGTERGGGEWGRVDNVRYEGSDENHLFFPMDYKGGGRQSGSGEAKAAERGIDSN